MQSDSSEEEAAPVERLHPEIGQTTIVEAMKLDAARLTDSEREIYMKEGKSCWLLRLLKLRNKACEDS
jgi:hypothetical protein